MDRRVTVMGVSVIGVPYHLDEYLPDLDLAPPPDQTITADLTQDDVWGRLAALYSAVGQAVAASASRGHRPVVVSGDCTTSLGTMAGLQQAGIDPSIVWLDAHGDVQTPETTASGYLGGMPLRLLAGYRPELIANRLSLRPVPEERIVLAGTRDLDPPEVEYLAGCGYISARSPDSVPPRCPTGRSTCTSTWTSSARTRCPACATPHQAARSPSRSPAPCAYCSTPARSSPSASPAPGTPAARAAAVGPLLEAALG